MRALSVDPLWPRAGDWPAPTREEAPDAVLLGIPAWRTSLSPTGAGETPAAVREALRRYSPTIMGPPPVDLNAVLRIADAGDVAEPDGREGEARVRAAVAELASARLLIALGGDNSATYAVAQGRRARGLVTLDAHFDLRDGESNGSPVRRLLAEGLDPRRVVQIGIADFANSAAYARRALDAGITVITLDEVRRRGIEAVVTDALRIASGGDSPHDAGAPDAGPGVARTDADAEEYLDTPGRTVRGGDAGTDIAAPAPTQARPAEPGGIHLDIDVDVCDRSVAPGCPASVPGGLAAWELRALVRGIARDPRVTSADIVEVDATADAADARTVRLAALCVLELLAGLADRP
ncbi:formiminoglutamase [Microbacterium proteolyticum]|uniref:Formiminoglutamase n=1 Tax=Microbacterium proteolyticum TaxID=1572644 RepID=A0A7W5CJN3_9MICO|nr:arginase family protein [Microbacterium proteolyticum]MBB3158856.1 formiminoglutamase [Microbacterium proteolyticum]